MITSSHPHLADQSTAAESRGALPPSDDPYVAKAACFPTWPAQTWLPVPHARTRPQRPPVRSRWILADLVRLPDKCVARLSATYSPILRWTHTRRGANSRCRAFRPRCPVKDSKTIRHDRSRCLIPYTVAMYICAPTLSDGKFKGDKVQHTSPYSTHAL
jgi:hypothetical protein